MGEDIKHHSDQLDGVHQSAINKIISENRFLTSTVMNFVGRNLSKVHGLLDCHKKNLSNSSKRLDTIEQRLTEFHKRVEVTLEGASLNGARREYDRCEAQRQTDYKLELILKYLAGFDCEISEMKIKAREMKTTIDALAQRDKMAQIDKTIIDENLD